MKIVRLIFILLISLLPLLIAKPVSAMDNPTTIDFGLYNAFYNVLEEDDLLIVAEGKVIYNLVTNETLRPDADGIAVNLTPSAGANWQCVSDSNDATYVETASTTYLYDYYAITDSTITSGTISSVSIYFRVCNSGANTTYAYPEFRINGDDYAPDAAQTATGSWATKYNTWTINPATNVNWAWNDINTLQVKINLLTSNAASNARCSEVYLVIAYTNIYPGGYSAEQAFLFDLLDTAGTSTLASIPLSSYGDRPIGIYLSASRVTTLGLVVGSPYKIRISGNPLIFATPTGNTVIKTLTAGDYEDQQLGVDSGVPTNNVLRSFLIVMAQNIEDYDNPSSVNAYVVESQGYNYITEVGGNIFIAGIPGLDTMCPILFQNSAEALQGDEQENTGTYASSLNPAGKWGTVAATGLTNLGVYLGLNQALAGSLVLFVVVIMLAVFVYQKTQSGVTVLLMVSATPFIGAYLGLMPIALAFIFVIIIVVLLGYFFFSRGAL
jgi:hypothetical protein